MKLISILFVVLFMNINAFAVNEQDIKPVMEKKVAEVLLIVQNKELLMEQKAQEIFHLMDELFDFSLMSRISLGKSWKKLTSQQKKDFSSRFEERLKDSFLDKLSLYDGQNILFKSVEKVKKNRIKLLSEIKSGDDVFAIEYKFYQAKTKQWYIYDVSIVGVSILQTYRKQFHSFLQTKTFDELLESL